MRDNYRTVYNYGQDEIIIKKSRFIGYAKPIDSEEDALKFIEEIKSKHRDATHNVYAYLVGENSNIQRFSDDGEPTGTAGIPVLEVIKKEDLRDLVVVVTRYFGGIKLGGGGLIRAYTKGAKIALEAARIVDMVVHRKLRIGLDYSMYGKIENYLLVNDYTVDDTRFDASINITICVENEELEEFITTITNLTSGDAEIEELELLHLPILNGKRL
ncbi:MAG TPA: YigZ family protein [Tissierellaceae bacterium]|mgnify:CR=1 FL=1|nr:YigZ family protein [Tissierellaceae bacterium]